MERIIDIFMCPKCGCSIKLTYCVNIAERSIHRNTVYITLFHLIFPLNRNICI